MDGIKQWGNPKNPPVISYTEDLDQFKRLIGNRDVTEARKDDIKRKILKIGYIPAPIIINEKYEIIDGQGRREACKDLGLGIWYEIVEGLTLEDCIVMNLGTTPWKNIDYIKSFAETGKPDYVKLMSLIDKYGDQLPLSTVICAVTGVLASQNPAVKNGTLSVSDENFVMADKMLSYVSSFATIQRKRTSIPRAPFYMVICFCYQRDEVDKDRLYESVSKYYDQITTSSKHKEMVDSISRVYNYKRQAKVYIEDLYRDYMNGKYGWYENKWGNR